MRVICVLLAYCLMAAPVGGAFSAYGAETAGAFAPEGAVLLLRRAMNEADVALLDKAADVEAVVGQAVDMFLADARAPGGMEALAPGPALILSSLKNSPQAWNAVRDLLRREAAEFVRYGVRSGSFSGRLRQAAPPSGILAPLFTDVSLGRKEIRGVGRAVSEGEGVYVPFTVRDHGNGNDYAVEARLRETGGRWRIVDVRNLRHIMERVRHEARESG